MNGVRGSERASRIRSGARHPRHPPSALSGYSAAELLGASCAPLGAPAELTVAGDVLRSRESVVVRHAELHPGEVTIVDGLRVTTPLRTAFDLGRRPLVESVVAVDALACVHRFSPDLLLNYTARDIRRDQDRIVREVTAALR